jgi:uncharacterized RDD family membrane protein YckC
MMTFCPKCGRQNDNAARFCQTCGNELRTIGPVSRAVFYAGFWQRFAAIIIDAVVVSLAASILAAGTAGFGSFALIFLTWLYEALMISSEKQATVGKMILGIIVTDSDGLRFSFVRATARHFAKYLSGLLLGIGFLMAAFTQKKQALHDMLVDTLVVAR